MRNYIKKSRAAAGRDLINNGSETSYPIGQAWIFKVKNTQLNSLAQAFGKLIRSFKVDGFVGMGQIIHGTYSDLNSVFNFGPQSKNHAASFAEFSKTLDSVEYSKTFTRVLIKGY